jgi:hypothetical protein
MWICRLINDPAVPVHYYCTFTICLISFPPITRVLFIMFPRWAATNWKWVRWNKRTLAAQIYNIQVPQTKGERSGGKREGLHPQVSKPSLTLGRKEHSLGQSGIWKVHSFSFLSPSMNTQLASLFTLDSAHLPIQRHPIFLPKYS